MPRFDFKARDASGKSVESAIEAPSRKDALRLLSTRGLSVTSVSDPAAAPAASGAPRKKAAAPAPASVFDAGALSARRGEIAPRSSERLPFLESLHELTTSGLS